MRDKVPEAGRAPISCLDYDERTSFDKRVSSEQHNLDVFRSRLALEIGDGTKITSRSFCGWQQMQLVSRGPVSGWAGNSPVWNISTGKPIIEDHNDFSNPLLLQVLRQLYLEAEDRVLMRLQTTVD